MVNKGALVTNWRIVKLQKFSMGVRVLRTMSGSAACRPSIRRSHQNIWF